MVTVPAALTLQAAEVRQFTSFKNCPSSQVSSGVCCKAD